MEVKGEHVRSLSQKHYLVLYYSTVSHRRFADTRSFPVILKSND